MNYRNFLQSLQQSLADNLESAIFETFENDSIKYDLYKESKYLAMSDKKIYSNSCVDRENMQVFSGFSRDDGFTKFCLSDTD